MLPARQRLAFRGPALAGTGDRAAARVAVEALASGAGIQ
jgi:hypothetical protein